MCGVQPPHILRPRMASLPQVNGFNFANDDLSCRFGELETAGTFVRSSHILCKAPVLAMGSVAASVPLAVRRGNMWSVAAETTAACDARLACVRIPGDCCPTASGEWSVCCEPAQGPTLFSFYAATAPPRTIASWPQYVSIRGGLVTITGLNFRPGMPPQPPATYRPRHVSLLRLITTPHSHTPSELER